MQKGDNPPTWRGASFRGLIASGIFVILLILLFGRPLGSSLIIGFVMLVFYIPAGYYMINVQTAGKVYAQKLIVH